MEVDIERISLYLREGALVPMRPVMNYVDEFPVSEVELLVSLFDGEGRACFDLPINDTVIPLEYTAAGGEHTLTIGQTELRFNIQTFGDGDLNIVRQ
jgi:alpha-glucosidase (family GH31 glycosyl hydrolase)